MAFEYSATIVGRMAQYDGKATSRTRCAKATTAITA